MPEISPDKTVLLRRAVEDDLPWILDQLVEFDKFSGYKRSLVADMDHAKRGVLDMIRAHFFMLAINPRLGIQYPETFLGFIAGWQTAHPFNPQLRVLTETFWWVAQEHRRSRAGLELLNAFTEWGALNCDMVIMTLEHHSPVNEKHLLRRGFKRKETAYLLEA